MKYGYSLFLKEYINPKDVEYEDCREFQIVCPECKEPVFKVCRTGNTHYFSHYKKDETLDQQCELRVNSISYDKIREIKNESRNQKLSLFLQVFQDIVWKNEYDNITIKKARQIYFALSRSKAFTTLKLPILYMYRKIKDDKSEAFDYFEEALDNIYRNRSDFGSEFKINLQKEFAYDLLQHLLAGNSKSNFLFLLNHAFILYLQKLEEKKKNSELIDWEVSMFDYLLRFLKTQNEKKRIQIIDMMGEYKMTSPYTHEEVDLFIMLGSYLMYTASDILLKIPYLEILREKQKQKGNNLDIK